MSKKKVKAKKLKMPLWQDLVYMALIMVAPIVITCIELFDSSSTVFKWSFASIGAILVTFIVIRKFVINEVVDRYKKEIASLEHDYSISVGDEKLCRQRWKRCHLIIYLYNSLIVLLWMTLIYIFVQALADGLIAFKGAATLILLFVLAGMVFKGITYMGPEYEEDENGETDN